MLCQLCSFCRRKNYRINQSNPARQYLRTLFSTCCLVMPMAIYKVHIRQLVGLTKNCCNGWMVTRPIKRGMEWSLMKEDNRKTVTVENFDYRLELVSGALQKYRTIVRQKSIAQYDPVYPIISNFLEKFYRTVN